MVPWVLARAKVATAIGVIALAAVIAALATYQTVATAKPERALPPPPLTVTAEEQDGYVALRLTNVGTKEIAGYAIVLKLREATRPRGLKAVHTMLVGHAADKTSPGRQAGESWIDQTATFKRRGSDRSKQLRIESSVDYVLYSDGRGWGVDAERRSLFLAGMRSGAAWPIACCPISSKILPSAPFVAGSRTTIKRHGCTFRALGAREAIRSSRSISASSTGWSVKCRIAR